MPKRGYGEGSIYKNSKTGKWVGQYKVGNKRKSIYGNSKKEIAERLNEILSDIRSYKYVDKSNKTINQILDRILKEQEKNNKIKPSTVYRNKQDQAIISRMYISDMPIQDVTDDQISDCLSDLIYDYSNSSIDKVYMKLARVFLRASTRGIIKRDPFAIKGNIEKPKSMKKDRKVGTLTLEEEQKLRKQIKEKDYGQIGDIVTIALNSGMRCGEIAGLRRR